MVVNKGKHSVWKGFKWRAASHLLILERAANISAGATAQHAINFATSILPLLVSTGMNATVSE